MNRQQIIAEVSKVVGKLKARREFSDFKEPSVVFEVKNNRTFARAFTTQWKLDFNEEVASKIGEGYRDTILHEVAHLMVQHIYKGRNKQSHGPEFRQMCRMIGCSGSTYATFEESKAIPIKRNLVTRHVYSCDCGNHFVTDAFKQKLSYQSNPCCTECDKRVKYVSSVRVPSDHPKFKEF